MEILFQSVSEILPGEKFRRRFERMWPGYHKWFLKEGDAARPSFLACERALQEHMPELLPVYRRLTELAGGSDQAARFLSLYNPTPYMTGCSQAVWIRGRPLLVRNYDYPANLWEATLLHTAWNGQRVIAMSDCMLGVLDGMNESGLAVSLAFGGRKNVGDGFGIPIILRYILEFCESTSEATEVLKRVPSHMSYNVTILDKSSQYATIFVAPDRATIVSRQQLATNHQNKIEWPEHEQATGSLNRAHFLSLRLHEEYETRERFISRFLEPPLYQFKHHQGWGTLYTSTYEPQSGQCSFRWPGYVMNASFQEFTEQTIALNFV